MTALVVFTIGWALGSVAIEAQRFHPVWLLLLLPIALSVGYAWRTAWARKVVWASAGILLGAVRMWLAQPVFDAAHVAAYRAIGDVELIGVVVAEPDVRPFYTSLWVRSELLIPPNDGVHPVHGDVLVRAPVYTQIVYGDRVRLRGKLDLPPTLEDFDYRAYLTRRGIAVMMTYPTIERLASHQANPVLEALYRFKAHAWHTLLRMMTEPQASLLAGILLGIESGIPRSLQEAFAATGTSHIVAISGFNISIIAGVLASLARRVGRGRGEFWLAAGGIALYTVLVGASASVVRAALMGSVTLAARAMDRRLHGSTSLAAAALLMAVLDAYVWWDAGFLLSLSATAGLLLFTEPLTHGFLRVFTRLLGPTWGKRVVGWLSEALIVTLAAQLTTLPILLALFKRLSLITLLTNLLILPAQPWVMLVGGVALLAALLVFPLGQIVGWGAWVLLSYTIAVVRWTGSLPWASVPFEMVSVPVVWGYYGGLGLALWWSRLPRHRRWRLLARLRLAPAWAWVAFVITVALGVTALLTLPDGRTHCTVLAVGQGDAVLVQTPTGRQVLVDGGPDPTRTLEALGRHMPFWDRHLDGVILTAPTADRLRGLLPVLERYQVDYVLIAPMTGTTTLETPWRTALAARASGTVGVLTAGSVWQLDERTQIRVLWPPERVEGPLVLAVEHGSQRVLLAGAATTVVERGLVEQWGEALRAQALLVPRHAAPTAATPELLRAVAPEAVIITLDKGEEPASVTLARLMDVPIYRTDRHGDVEVVLDGARMRIRTHK